MVLMDLIPKQLPTTDIADATMSLFEAGSISTIQLQEWMSTYLYGVQNQYFWHAAVIQLVLTLTAFIATAMVIIGTAHAQAATEVAMKAVWSQLRPRLVPAIITAIILNILTTLLFLLLIVPGIIFANYWAFVIVIVLLTHKQYWQAMQESKAMVRGRWWEVFVHITFATILVSLITLIFFAAIGTAVTIPGISAVTQTIAYIITAFVTVFTTVLYMHLRELGAERV